MPRISSLGMLRWEGCKFEASRGCIARSCLQTDGQKDAIERGRKPAVAVRIPNRPGLVVYSCNAALAEVEAGGLGVHVNHRFDGSMGDMEPCLQQTNRITTGPDMAVTLSSQHQEAEADRFL